MRFPARLARVPVRVPTTKFELPEHPGVPILVDTEGMFRARYRGTIIERESITNVLRDLDDLARKAERAARSRGGGAPKEGCLIDVKVDAGTVNVEPVAVRGQHARRADWLITRTDGSKETVRAAYRPITAEERADLVAAVEAAHQLWEQLEGMQGPSDVDDAELDRDLMARISGSARFDPATGRFTVDTDTGPLSASRLVDLSPLIYRYVLAKRWPYVVDGRDGTRWPTVDTARSLTRVDLLFEDPEAADHVAGLVRQLKEIKVRINASLARYKLQDDDA